MKRTGWAVTAFYLVLAFEFFYMASPFAAYFYSVYSPGLAFLGKFESFRFLVSFFLPHIVSETSSLMLDIRNLVGVLLFFGGGAAFLWAMCQVYWAKIRRKGAVLGGMYRFIRHPQYTALAICGLGMLILWPRYVILVSYVTMLFVYLVLARIEERECRVKFGQSYADYASRTHMFLPFPLPLADKLPSLPTRPLARAAILGLLFVLMLTGSLLAASGLRTYSLNSLYADYREDTAVVSLIKISQADMDRAMDLAMAAPETTALLAEANADAETRYIFYLLPTDFDVSEIPMNPVENGREGHHFLPQNFGDIGQWKLVLTKAVLPQGQSYSDRDIVARAFAVEPLGEVWVDLSENQIIQVVQPPATGNYEGIPMPVF